MEKHKRLGGLSTMAIGIVMMFACGIALADQDADNRVNFSEFVQMMANVEKISPT